MRQMAIALVTGLAMAAAATAQSSRAAPPAAGQRGGTKSAPVIQTEKIQVPESLQAPPASMANQPGYMPPGQAKQLLVKIWQAESRVRDLMSQAHPELLRLPTQQAVALGRAMETLGEDLETLETARAQFAGRVDSEYLAFQAYAALANLLPTLGRTGDMVYRYQSPQLGGMFRQSWNDLFVLEEALQPYVAFLTRNHDQIYALTQGNLYNCQHQLSTAMRTHAQPAKPIRNIVPEFKGRRVRRAPAHPKAAPKP